MKIIGIVPARMAASRFPGKPMFNIIDRPMINHVYQRALLYNQWNYLSIATCDDIIHNYALNQSYNSIMTSDSHTRALDRITEAVTKIKHIHIDDDDVIINVQGDEPMLHPEMFDALIKPIQENSKINCTVLAMDIEEESIWRNPDTVKIIHNEQGEVLYTSRAPVPYSGNKFSKEIKAKRIYGLFAFKWKYLKMFSEHPETRLEKLESCDSNRILDMNFTQYIAPFPYIPSFSVDNIEDIKIVESNIKNDKYWGKY